MKPPENKYGFSAFSRPQGGETAKFYLFSSVFTIFINLSVDDLRAEYVRIKNPGIAAQRTAIRFINVFSPYWYFTFMDPDGNPVEITGGYTEDAKETALE